MDAMIALALFLVLFCMFLILRSFPPASDPLPPGSMGLPVVGQSLVFLRALRSNTVDKWLASRIRRYGPVSKLRLFGIPTVLVSGRAAHKFVFTNEADALALQRPPSMSRILGRRNLLELMGEDHARVRGALTLFLRPEMLKRYVGAMDGEVRRHLEKEWHGRDSVMVLPLMKTLTFDIICSLLFGLERGGQRESLLHNFVGILDGAWSVPIDLPFTRFRRGCNASRRAKKLIADITAKKRDALERGLISSAHQDLITYLLSAGMQDSSQALTTEEIVDNVMLVMIAGHDTTSVLITFLLHHLAKDPVTYSRVLQEQVEIARSKAPGKALSWDDLSKMKYTWSVALETLRMVPPVFGGFRKVLKDVDFAGYRIPRGWQVGGSSSTDFQASFPLDSYVFLPAKKAIPRPADGFLSLATVQVYWASSTTHMDETVFREPWRFDPSRFEDPSSIPPYCFVAFGGGARICPGNVFARLETLVAVHYIVTRFRWKLVGVDDSVRRNPLPSPARGLLIQIEHRAV